MNHLLRTTPLQRVGGLLSKISLTNKMTQQRQKKVQQFQAFQMYDNRVEKKTAFLNFFGNYFSTATSSNRNENKSSSKDFSSSTNIKTTTREGNANAPSKNKNEIEEELSEIPPLPNNKSRLQLLWKRYGLVFVFYYGTVYVVSLSTMYQLVSHDYISATGAIDWIKHVGLDSYVDVTKINSKAGNFALAWILTKFTEPLRLAWVVATTPKVSRVLGFSPQKVKKNKNV